MLQGVSLKNSLTSEGYTYGGAQHVYDTAKKQLTVMVFDRAPINNFTDMGLARLRKEFIPLRVMTERHTGDGEMGAVFTYFFWSDPDRYLKFCIWRDESFAGRLGGESNAEFKNPAPRHVALMEDIFGSLDRLNQDWERWVKQQRATFHHVDWGWEQEGNTLKAYGYPSDPKYWSQMNIMYAPNEKAEYEPLRMDYPAEPMPQIVGPVKRGVAEPSVGYVADLTDGGGWVGYGLGVSNRSMCQVVMVDGKLIVEGKGMPIPRREFVLPEDVKTAVKQNRNQYGVTIQIKARELAIAVRGGKGAIKEMKVSVPLDAESRERIMTHNMALVAKDGRPKITPFFDDGRKPDPDLTQPAPANRWRFAGLDRLETLYKAAWRLKDETPGSLLKLKTEMLAAVDKDAATQARAVRAYEARIDDVARDVRGCRADSQTKALALGDLAGVFMTFSAGRSETPGKLKLQTRLCGRLDEGVSGTLSITVQSNGENTVVATHPISAPIRRIQSFIEEPQVADASSPRVCKATANLRWRGETISLTLTQ